MSADNGVYILRTKDQCRVAHIQGVDNIYYSYIDGDWRDIKSKENKYVPTRVVEMFGDCKFTRNERIALDIASKWANSLPICEYGVCVLTYNKTWKHILDDAEEYAKKEGKYASRNIS